MSDYICCGMVMNIHFIFKGKKHYAVRFNAKGSIPGLRYTKIKAKTELRKRTMRLEKKRMQREAWSYPLKYVPKDATKRKQWRREITAYYDDIRYQDMLDAFNGL
jgi:hypothetical protein